MLSGLAFYIGLATTHVMTTEPVYGWNESNQLFAVQYERFLVGTMENSFHQRSYLAAYDLELTSFSVGGVPVTAGLYAGAISGYDSDCILGWKKHCNNVEELGNDILPLGAAYARAGYVQVNFMGQAINAGLYVDF